MGEYLVRWLHGKHALRPSTHAAYAIHVRRYLAPHLGHLLLTDLTPEDIEQMYRALSTDPPLPEAAGGLRPASVLSPSSLQRIHATLMSALSTAVRRGLINRNPAATIELPRPTRPRVRTWNSEEVARFLRAISGDELCVLYRLLAVTGLRRGEAVALRWGDVDLNSGALGVERSAVRTGNQIHLGPPKSVHGVRTVALDDETARQLHWHATRQHLTAVRGQRPTDAARPDQDATATPDAATPDAATPDAATPHAVDGAERLVFPGQDGAVLDPAYVSRYFDRLIRRHGLPRIRLHDLRHTSASLGLEAGESLLEVSRRLGHSSIVITADVYSHVSPVVAKEASERLANLLDRAPRTPDRSPAASAPLLRRRQGDPRAAGPVLRELGGGGAEGPR
ncbi:tyrosine-type recombinase/integrase [Nocardioides sp. NPDC092400]|uniref:tyrosine-type recombinase/integrase n=1 Tax=Nocardioides sp. NPDC092400 TaxID=3155196 RepID=UPI00342AF483